jgi:hypothetical protein
LLHKAKQVTIVTDNNTIPQVPTFCYLGQVLAANNSDWPAIYKNLKKVLVQWGLLSQPLIQTSVSPRYQGYFYKAVVQSVLLYSSESWTVTPQMIAVLRRFHHKIARCISVYLPQQNKDNTWLYPLITKALEIAGLFPIKHYIRVHQNTVAIYIATRPILQLCEDEESSHTSYQQQFRQYRWWSQPLCNEDSDSEDSNDTTTRQNLRATPTRTLDHDTTHHITQDDAMDISDTEDDTDHTTNTTSYTSTPQLTPLTHPSSILSLTYNTPLHHHQHPCSSSAPSPKRNNSSQPRRSIKSQPTPSSLTLHSPKSPSKASTHSSHAHE